MISFQILYKYMWTCTAVKKKSSTLKSNGEISVITQVCHHSDLDVNGNQYI